MYTLKIHESIFLIKFENNFNEMMILSHIEPSDLFMPMSIILLAEIYCLSVKRIKNVFLLSPTQSLHNGENVSFAKNILEMCFEAI